MLNGAIPNCTFSGQKSHTYNIYKEDTYKYGNDSPVVSRFKFRQLNYSDSALSSQDIKNHNSFFALYNIMVVEICQLCFFLTFPDKIFKN